MSESTPPAADSADASKGAGGVRLSDGPYRLDGCVHGVLVCDAAGRGIGLAKHLDAGLALRDRLNAERSARLNAERDRDRHREKAGLLREQAELRWAANTRADAADARVKELEEDGDHRAAVLREWHDRAVALESDLATARAERDEQARQNTEHYEAWQGTLAEADAYMAERDEARKQRDIRSLAEEVHPPTWPKHCIVCGWRGNQKDRKPCPECGGPLTDGMNPVIADATTELTATIETTDDRMSDDALWCEVAVQSAYGWPKADTPEELAGLAAKLADAIVAERAKREGGGA